MIQDDLPIFRSITLIISAKSLLPYNITFPGARNQGIDIFGEGGILSTTNSNNKEKLHETLQTEIMNSTQEI